MSNFKIQGDNAPLPPSDAHDSLRTPMSAGEQISSLAIIPFGNVNDLVLSVSCALYNWYMASIRTFSEIIIVTGVK